MDKADVYRITDALVDASLEVMAARLEARGKHPRFTAMLEEYLDAMQIDGARTSAAPTSSRPASHPSSSCCRVPAR